jgi:hypothetical protein
MRWAGLSRRSEFDADCESGVRIQPDRLGKTGLTFIEGPEALRLQFQRAGYV